MHVLMTTDTLSSVWTYTRELACELDRRGWRVTLVSFGEIPLPEQISWMKPLCRLDYRPTAFRLDWMEEGQRDFIESSAYLLSIANELRPDVFHCNHLCYGNAVRTPGILVAHGDYLTWWRSAHGSEPRDSSWLRWYRRKIAGAISQAAVLVAPTRWMLNEVHTTYGACVREQVILPGRNPIEFNPYVTKEDSVVAVGRRLDATSGIHLLARCALPVPLVVAEEHLPLPHASAQTGPAMNFAGNNVRFAGPQTEAQLRLLYSRASVFASTSRYETSGMPVTAAAFSRCALVLNDVPPLRELWRDSAMYFSRNDKESLSQAIDLLSRDECLRLELANRAFRRARERFTAKRMADDYIALYHSLMTPQAVAA
jgi:glycosyltransferase involved in cell wall biosynthesis